jgi:O-antigen/teichoic acid export membrane protein
MSFEKKKTIEGAKWTVIIFGLTTIFAFVINLFLAKISPEIVGYYSLVTIFISTITTFVFVGGSTVLPTLVPKIESRVKKASFISSYFILLSLFVMLSMLIVLFFPAIFELFLKKEISNNLFIMLLILIPFMFLLQYSQWILNSIFEIKLSSIVEKLRVILLFVFLPIIYLVDNSFFIDNFIEVLIALTILSYIYGIKLAFNDIAKSLKVRRIKLFYFPEGFWKFLLTAQSLTILSYFFNNFDKLMVIQHFGIRELGIYSIIILIWIMTRFIPQLLSKTQIPIMAKYIKEKNYKEINKIFYILNRYTILLSIFIGFFILIFGTEILSFFGKDYQSGFFILSILILTSSFLTLSYSVTPLLISLEFNRVRMVNSVTQIFIQIVVTYLLIDSYGVLGVVIGVALSVVLAQIYPYYKIFNLNKYNFQFPNDYFYGFILTTIVFFIINFININTLFFKIFLFIIVIILYLFLINFNTQDINRVKSLIRGKHA